ncbi:unnamed protein product [Rangifer tarandus platyrhynchus]|uniref:Uncharacterized protein n=1 Tax=Rangifer tarandus platyrhynchus TaxID=3082113 RepID=A0AC59Z3R4_RANTA
MQQELSTVLATEQGPCWSADAKGLGSAQAQRGREPTCLPAPPIAPGPAHPGEQTPRVSEGPVRSGLWRQLSGRQPGYERWRVEEGAVSTHSAPNPSVPVPTTP